VLSIIEVKSEAAAEDVHPFVSVVHPESGYLVLWGEHDLERAHGCVLEGKGCEEDSAAPLERASYPWIACRSGKQVVDSDPQLSHEWQQEFERSGPFPGFEPGQRAHGDV
jgi:hypothetical protein